MKARPLATGTPTAPETTQLVRLHPDSVEAVAQRCLEVMDARPNAAPEFVDPQTLARRLGVKVGYVYAHAEELGCRRLGEGPKPRLRFDAAEAEKYLTAHPPRRESPDQRHRTSPPKTPSVRKSSMGTEVRLLPIKQHRRKERDDR